MSYDTKRARELAKWVTSWGTASAVDRMELRQEVRLHLEALADEVERLEKKVDTYSKSLAAQSDVLKEVDNAEVPFPICALCRTFS